MTALLPAFWGLEVPAEETLRDPGHEHRPVATPQGEKGLKRQLAFATPNMNSKLPRQTIDLSVDSDDERAPYEPTEPDDDQSQSCLSDGDEPGLRSVPDIRDPTAPRPKAGEVRLSRSAINSRLRRIMKPNVHGHFKGVPGSDSRFPFSQEPENHRPDFPDVRLRHGHGFQTSSCFMMCV